MCVCVCVFVCVSLFSRVPLFTIPWTIGSSVHGIFQARVQEGLPCPPPGDLPNPGTEPPSHVSCVGRCILYHSCHLGSPLCSIPETNKKLYVNYINNSRKGKKIESKPVDLKLQKAIIICFPFLCSWG